MNRSFLKVSVLIFALGACLQSAHSQSSVAAGLRPLPLFLDSLDFESCIQDLPPPTLLSEPRFTQGARNVISILLPALANLPFSPDTVRSPIIITLVLDGDATFEFPRPVQLGDDMTVFETVTGLKNGSRYGYTTALFLPVCKIPCAAVTDPSQLELHCSTYRDTAWSTQDAVAPVVAATSIPQLVRSPVAGWWNQPSFEIQADVSDPAGVWQAFLYRRTRSESEWGMPVSDSTFASELTDSGFLFAESVNAIFRQSLADGYYEFRIDGKDATHTPESSFPNFVLAGNSGQAIPDGREPITIKIDTTPPDSVTLTAQQISNTIQLSWSPSDDPAPGIGLSGYRIYRNGAQIDSVDRDGTSYLVSFPGDAPTAVFTFQIQPFDSLGNAQSLGGRTTIEFIGTTEITMVAEPEFTPGTDNQICWRRSPIVDSYTISIAENSNFGQATRSNLTDTCFTFSGLTDGVTYSYWVEAIDRQQRPVVSDTVSSTQDGSAPEITNLSIEAPVLINGRTWVNQRDVRLQVAAVDVAPGRIRAVNIFERDRLAVSFILSHRSAALDTVLSFNLTSPECQDIAIRAVVDDGAGNLSSADSILLKLDATPPPAVTNLSGQQLAMTDGIRIEWAAVADASGCSGMEGYRVLRDGQQVARTHPDSTGYVDSLSAGTASGRFTYQVLPFDSLQNRQGDGTAVDVDYQAAPSIVIQSLPEFTAGLSNEICWTVDGTLVTLKLFVDRGCVDGADLSLDISSLASGSVCQSLSDLADGQRYCYWLEGVDQQQRTVGSAVVSSTQDNTPPVIESFTFPNGDSLNEQIWAFSRHINLQIGARDVTPGEIWRFEIFENGSSATELDNPDSSAQLSQVFPHTIGSQDPQPATVNLRAVVYDGAGNASAEIPLQIFYQEDLPNMYAYPNPFNPTKGGVTIRLDDANESELKIYDFFGNLVQTISAKANSHDFSWDGRNGHGEMVANGGYICVGTKTNARFKIGVFKRNL